jgi:ornithine cyclodeaminase/alanine dehydrogenase-like protein (mu-crystallin family)
VLHFDAADVRARLPWPALIDALRAMFVSGCEVPPRHAHHLGEAGTMLLMPAWQAGGLMGVKTVNIFPGNGALGLPGVHASYALFDARTGVPLALLDGSELTARRTAAASALAASFLARQDARHLLVVGAGRVGGLTCDAMRAVRPGIDTVRVWNRHPAAAQSLVARLLTQGLDARVVHDLQAAAAQAHIISCATLSTEPLICGEWLAPGTHLDLVGSFTPAMREADGACFARGQVFVDTDEALVKSGDVLQAAAEGHFDLADTRATLAQLCSGERAGRGGPDEITLFKSVGTALEDLAAAALVWGGARGATHNAAPTA